MLPAAVFAQVRTAAVFQSNMVLQRDMVHPVWGSADAGEKIKVDDAVTLSENSNIGKPTVKKYTDEDSQIILGIAVNDPVTMTGGRRKTSILVLGHLFRLKLASGLSNIAVNDRIALSSTGAIKSDDGEYIAMHPVASSDDYNYIEVFRPYDIGEA